MSAPALVGSAGPTLRIRGTPYPVLLPRLRDPRLHLAAVIVSLQVLGQVAFEFQLSIAQIAVALLTCAVLEIAIAFRRQRVILWPASALLTGNGVAFVLRAPGTEHGDWWSLHGWWIFACTAALALLSKHVVRWRGRHVFNPSNIGLVLCFLLLGSARADPLAFWWGPMSGWLVLALAIIVAGGLAILSRLGLLAIAVGFWLAFAGGIGVLAASGHQMTARWHLGPITGTELWRVLVFSPEILVFLFFMITDPRTIPEGRGARRVYAVAVALVAVLMIAPQSTEFGSKVAVLGALALVCVARPLLHWLRSKTVPVLARTLIPRGHSGRAAVALAGVLGFAGLVVVAGIPARPPAAAAAASEHVEGPRHLPRVTVGSSKGVESRLDRATSLRIARSVVTDLRIEADALRRRDEQRAGAGAGGTRLQDLWTQIRASHGRPVVVPIHDVDELQLTLEAQDGQGPPLVVARLSGTTELLTYTGSPPTVASRGDAGPFERTLELSLVGNRYLITRIRSGGTDTGAPARPASGGAVATGMGGVQLRDVASQVGLDFRQGAFRFRVDPSDQPAMMGGGVCWLDYDGDGWMDLFVVNSYSELDSYRWEQHGGLPRSALFHNEQGRFVDVSRASGAGLALRGNGCVAADFDLDGRTDLYVTATGYDALLWNRGDGTFGEGAGRAGITLYGWHSGAVVADVNGDGRPDLFVAGYTDRNAPITGAEGGFPNTYQGVRDLLYLNEGRSAPGRVSFREVGVQAGLENARPEHGLGALFTDVNDDGRLDLYVANDANPNRLYVNVARPGGTTADPARLGFRFEERARDEGVADPNAGMGIASADYTGDGRADLLVTNSHKQLHAAYRSRPSRPGKPSFTDARPDFASAFDTRLAGWGVSWVDLDLDGNLDLVLANGAIPVIKPARDAERIQVLENLAAQGRPGRFADAGELAGLRKVPSVIGRGLAAADYDNDGHVDVAVNSVDGPLVLLRSTGGTGRWLEVDLGTFAPGAVVTAVLPDGRRLVREVHAGSSYLSSEDPRVHFGLGDAAEVSELLVHYPGGHETRLTHVATNRLVVVDPEP